ncbi:hypothetical protein PUNSTDRAFT_126308 [Punctularia strigosozonata HHB-11173 SS5]|uniref:uncharacterized protein n=1 Tax=Punctularia strigosozonata (strain HHB-11173) TaxID=741275 RepID=UPI0004417687|nr:uncharacterized protein PUNSTDRAFT_126308 [Punctularia strigosozonata HHB-11173 SS5]EIN09373.1 hypothetical protein PUNSTDRAFT_126308 [Punctularia strigosozonata HHB-11173 SS5]
MSPALIDGADHPNGLSNGKHKPALDGFGTRAIHVGSEPDPSTGAVIPPLSLSTTYKQSAVGVHAGFEYSRSGNPNRNALEALLASLEVGGADALAFASGSAATATVLQSLGAGAHVVSVNDVYGGTFRYMTRVAAENQAVETTFVDLEKADEDSILAAFRPNTKLVWIESPTNPTLRVIDIPAVVRLAHAHPSRPAVLVDNTFLSPFYSSPLLQGADLVLHSLTKYINGHSDVVMGAVIVPPQHITSPSSSGEKSLGEKLRFLQNAIGAVPSPHDCWLAQRGLKTLHLRMKAHGTNALALARALEKNAHVEEVIYPGLPSHPRHEIARRSLAPHAQKFVDSLPKEDDGEGGFPYGGMISFRIRGGAEEADAFLQATRLFTLAESLGGVESLAELPAKMTHGSVPPAEREKLGIGENLVRLSVGVEEVEDLIADVERALEIAVGGRHSRMISGFSLSAFTILAFAQLAATTQVIPASSHLIHYHGRWDSIPSTWWPGSGFKLAFSTAPKNLTLNVGASVSTPPITVSARFGDVGEWVTLNLTAGANIVPLTSVGLVDTKSAVLDVVTQFEGGTARLELQSIELDDAAKLTTYTPKKLAFEFIGDSLTAGYLSERGVVDDWSFKVGDYFKAEHNQIAQSGACLTDQLCWGNPRGMSYLYFQTQNSAYEWLNNNITTSWNFASYKPQPTHVFINIGTNDNYYGINGTAFEKEYISFLHNLRTIYPSQPIFVMSPWGYPTPSGLVPYFQTEDAAVVAGVKDKNVFLVNGTGWIQYGDTFPDYTHPTPNGHSKIAYHMIDYLLKWGLKVD